MESKSNPGITNFRANYFSHAGQFQHAARIATKCRHGLHQSAPLHMPYCPACIYATAKSNLDIASENLSLCGGPCRSSVSINMKWRQTWLSYKVATKRWEEVRKKNQLRSEREHAWDEAHSSAGVVGNGPDGIELSGDCPVCRSMIHQPNEPPKEVNRAPWWERAGALSSLGYKGPQTPPRSHRRKRRRRVGPQHLGSPTMRGIIRQHRAARVAERTAKDEVERRHKTETAMRRKHQLAESQHFSSDFWDQPISGIITRQYHKSQKEYQRMSERRKRGNTPRHRPPRSSLSICESAANVKLDGNGIDALRLAEEEREREWLEKSARRVGTEVGYLYFLGTIDGLTEWREEYLRSDHELVWRDRQRRENEADVIATAGTEDYGDPMEIDG